MKVISAPTPFCEPTLFLGGSISGAWNWQQYAIDRLSGLDVPLTVFNPRRENFDISDQTMERQQIEWEFRHLRMADALLFWFSGETLAPITLFELGRHSIIAGRPLFIGIDPNYKRKRDVEIQMSLINPQIPIHYRIDVVLECVKLWAMNRLP